VIRRLHIAGSANRDVDAVLLRDAHAVVRSTVDGWTSRGGTLVGGLGGEPTLSGDAGLSTIFDWSVADAALDAVRDGRAQPRSDGESLLCVRTSRIAFDHIPSHRQPTYDALAELGALDLQLLPDNWRSGALMRRAQAELGGVLVTFSGGAGVEDLANLYVEAERPVVPIDVDLGSSNDDGALGGGTGLARRALADPGSFLRLADGSSPVAALTQLSMGPNRAAASELAQRLLALLGRLEKPRAFCVRLLDPNHAAFPDVERFFETVVRPVLEESGLRVVDLGHDPQERAWMNDEIFAQLHTAHLAIVDLTGSRPNCFIELGYALGRGHSTIVTAREGEDMQFDDDKLPWHFWNPHANPLAGQSALRDHIRRFGARAPLVQPIRLV
jgi:hypothetical protein